MRVYAKGSVDVPLINGKPIIIDVPSSNGKKIYKVDLSLGRCSCLGWAMHTKNGSRKPCKHLLAYGYTAV